MPIILETEFIVDLLLVEVPRYAIIFTRLIIINSLLESFTFTMAIAIQATGVIKWNEIVVSGILLLNVPISYLFLKTGSPPESTLIVSIFLSFSALMLRLSLLKRQISELKVKQFVFKVFVVSAVVTIAAISIPMYIRSFFEPGWNRFVIVTLSGLITTPVAIWILGLTINERSFILSIIKEKSFNEKQE